MAFPPKTSKTKDNFSHHSSPNSPTAPQQPPFVQKPPARVVTGTVRKTPDVPMHVTKHPNPVGRPKSPRY